MPSEFERRVQRIEAIRKELLVLYSQTQPGVTLSTVGMDIVSGSLTVTGCVLAIPTGGTSLILSAAGLVLLLIDLARQVQSAA